MSKESRSVINRPYCYQRPGSGEDWIFLFCQPFTAVDLFLPLKNQVRVPFCQSPCSGNTCGGPLIPIPFLNHRVSFMLFIKKVITNELSVKLLNPDAQSWFDKLGKVFVLQDKGKGTERNYTLKCYCCLNIIIARQWMSSLLQQ